MALTGFVSRKAFRSILTARRPPKTCSAVRQWPLLKETAKVCGPVLQHPFATQTLSVSFFAGSSTMRLRGRSARRFPVASARCSVPRDNQHWPCRAAEYTFADRALSESLPPAPPIGSKDDKIGFPPIRMQDNHAGRIAGLLNGSNRNALALCTLPQAGQKFEPFALVQ